MSVELEDDEPLDPATERVRRKMMRLMLVSISIMMVGLMAVLGAIVYKVSDGNGDTENATSGGESSMVAESRLKIPVGATIVSTSLDGSKILIHLRRGTEESLLVFDLRNGNTVATVAIE